MTALASYSTGTVSVADGGTTVTAIGAIWSGTNARPGDVLQIGNFQTIISDIVDTDEATIPPWGGGALSGVAYKIWHVSPQRFAGAQAMADVSTLVAALNKEGFYWFVDTTETEPDPSLGNDGQYASQPTTGKTWVKVGGVWTFLGIYKAFQLKGAWDSGTDYTVGDVVSLGGSSYVCVLDHTNHTPPDTTYWQLLAERGTDGDAATVAVGTVTTGAGGSAAAIANVGTSSAAIFDFTIPAGKSYGGTSTTSLTIGTGSKVFTTQAGLAYTNGARVRASSAANTSNWMEGLATYSGTTLTLNVDKTNGSGTLADWNFNVVGQPGAGDMSSTNYASEYIGHEAEVRKNLGIPGKSYIINGGMQISQENGATAGTTSGFYPVDMFDVQFSNGGAVSIAQVASATPGGSPNRLRVTVTTADATVAAGDTCLIGHRVEGRLSADLLFGSASAKAITIQFGVKAPAGTYCVTVLNSAANRSYVAEYVIAGGEANTDVVKSVTIPGDTSGTWLANGGVGLQLRFGLMAGSSSQQAAGAWGTGNPVGSSSQFNLMGTLGNVFELFDVALYEGSFVPVFRLPDFDVELDRCQRYWEKSYDYSVAPGTAGNFNGARASLQNSAPAAYGAGNFLKRKRAAPTVTLYSPNSGASGNGYDNVDRAATAARVGETGYHISNVLGSSTTPIMYHFTANARL